MKKLLITILLATGCCMSGQTISIQVINSAGMDHQVGGFWITDNVGEAFTETFGPTASVLLTQGFLQQDIITVTVGGVTVFNGVTPNGDGRNDKWMIDGITEFPNNSVMLFNRWGRKIYEEKGYDNESKYWPLNDDLNELLSSTYFYIIDLGNGSKPIKGWVELIKN
jgi:gliding motility-associated-like protein